MIESFPSLVPVELNINSATLVTLFRLTVKKSENAWDVACVRLNASISESESPITFTKCVEELGPFATETLKATLTLSDRASGEVFSI